MSTNTVKGEEQLLERAFKLETLYKKYKIFIWAIFIGAILFFIGKSVMKTMEESRLSEANNAFLVLEKTPTDANALETLKSKNPVLFELFTFSQANKNKDLKMLETLKSSKNTIIADASGYIASVLSNKPVESVLYHDMVLLEEAYLAIKSGDKKLAKTKLTLIDEKSDLYKIASLLKHATLKGK